jgi:uncharacterized protein (TIGR01732 family)
MYYYGGGSCGCSGMNQTPYYPVYNYGSNYGNNSNYAIILVLFILLVIIIGTRYAN